MIYVLELGVDIFEPLTGVLEKFQKFTLPFKPLS